MQKKLNYQLPKGRHIVSRTILMILAILMLIPIAITILYSFFSPEEIKAYMATRGSFDAAQWMDVKLAPNMFSLSQYYKILIQDTSVLKMFVNSAFYTVMILLGQAVVVPMMAYALSRFEFKGREAIFFMILMLMLLPVSKVELLMMFPAASEVVGITGIADAITVQAAMAAVNLLIFFVFIVISLSIIFCNAPYMESTLQINFLLKFIIVYFCKFIYYFYDKNGKIMIF